MKTFFSSSPFILHFINNGKFSLNSIHGRNRKPLCSAHIQPIHFDGIRQFFLSPEINLADILRDLKDCKSSTDKQQIQRNDKKCGILRTKDGNDKLAVGQQHEHSA